MVKDNAGGEREGTYVKFYTFECMNPFDDVEDITRVLMDFDDDDTRFPLDSSVDDGPVDLIEFCNIIKEQLHVNEKREEKTRRRERYLEWKKRRK